MKRYTRDNRQGVDLGSGDKRRMKSHQSQQNRQKRNAKLRSHFLHSSCGKWSSSLTLHLHTTQTQDGIAKSGALCHEKKCYSWSNAPVIFYKANFLATASNTQVLPGYSEGAINADTSRFRALAAELGLELRE